MKYPKLLEALDRISYLIGMQISSDRGTQETAEIQVNVLAIVWQVTRCYLLPYEHVHSPLHLSKMTISTDEITSIYVYVYICACVFLSA